MDMTPSRREFLKQMATAVGGVVLVPVVTGCPAEPKVAPKPTPSDGRGEAAAKAELPLTKPADWDPIAYNKERGNAGAIPESYHASINGPDGDTQHLGKHLPYVPKEPAAPAGMLAIMWGDPAKGYAKHPNAARGEANKGEGHWYNWIKVRKATDGDAEELKSQYPEWPPQNDDHKKGYVVQGGGEITADGGKNTVYLAGIPKDCKPGDTVRIWAHCLTHGEYVDFLTV